jgi:hypothetical protein
MAEPAKAHGGFEFGSEQFLAAVLYVARDAQRQYAKHKRGSFGRWWYLNRVRQRLELSPEQLDYASMRRELIRFAETFGVTDPTVAASIREADPFDDIEEQK